MHINIPRFTLAHRGALKQMHGQCKTNYIRKYILKWTTQKNTSIYIPQSKTYSNVETQLQSLKLGFHQISKFFKQN